jgi:Flp pilus assembly protein TadD
MLDFRGLIEQALLALEQDRPADAEKHIRAALGVSPRDDQLLNLLGVSLIQQHRPEEAIEPLRKAISLNRRDAEYHNALGCALRNTGRFAECVESFGRALKLDPGLLGARYNLGLGYQKVGHFAQAEQQFRAILARNPHDTEAVGALANLRWFTGDHEGAVAELRRGIEANPASGDMRFLLGEQLLALGRFEEGWFRYLWRVNRHTFLRKIGLAFNDPRLMAPLPESLAGVEIRVHGEQGLGDDLFFLRFAPLLRARGARVRGAVEPRILDMVSRSGVLDTCEPALERTPSSADYRLLADLPYLLQAHRQPVPAAVRFAPLPAKLAEAAERLHGLPRPLIGLTWRAGTGPEADKPNLMFKEVPFELFCGLARALSGTLLVLQRAPRPGEVQALTEACGPRVVDLSALNADLEAMHALLGQLDDYVGVSNTNMHLCEALGRGARVLVSAGTEFRWMASGRESPWFPGFRIYRQATNGHWEGALDEIRQDLAGKYN